MISQSTIPLLVGYSSRGKDAALLAPSAKQLSVYQARVFNRSGSTMDCGIVRKFAQVSAWLKFFTFDGSNYADATATIFAGSAVSAIPAVADKGFVVATKNRSGLIGITISATSTTGAYLFQYWNGSSWVTLTTIDIPDFKTTGDFYISFLPPSDWAKGGAADLPSDMYCVRVTSHTTAPSPAVAFTSVWAGELIEFVEGLADNAGLSIEFDADKPFTLEASQGLMPYFGTASASNGMQIAYSTV